MSILDPLKIYKRFLKLQIKARKTLVDNSQNALHYEWVMDLRALINDTIALLEITLNQIYIKAEFYPQNI